MYGYQGAGSGGWSVTGRLGGGNAVKAVLVFVGLLIIAAFVTGLIFKNSYWGNPAEAEALADRIDIENEGLEERQRIELQAYQQTLEEEAQARRERARRALLWQDGWNTLGMILAVVTVAGLLTIAGIRIAVPVTAQAYERYAGRHAQLVEHQIRLAEKQIEQEVKHAQRLREKRRLEETRLQWARVPIIQEQDGGNGRARGSHWEQSAMSSQNTGGSSIPRKS